MTLAALAETSPAIDAPMLDLAALDDAKLETEPYLHVVVENLLAAGAAELLAEDYPEISATGYVTLPPETLPPAFAALDAELKGHELTERLSRKFSRDMHAFPRLVTYRRWSEAREGHIHTDSERKVMTMLIYLNMDWTPSDAGCIRVLYGKEFEPYARQVTPTTGKAFAFVRSDNSWHGHLPFKGERRVVQVTWLRDAEAMDRKMSNNKLHQSFKRIFGRFGFSRDQAM